MPTGYITESQSPFTAPESSGLALTIPPLITPGATHDYDAKSLVVAAGSSVSSWPDQISTTPLTGTSLPTLERESNGAPYVKFAASAFNMLLLAESRATPHTTAIIGRYRNAPPYSNVMALVGSGSNGSSARAIVGVSGAGRPLLYQGVVLENTSITVVAGQWFARIDVHAGASSLQNFNGATITGNSGSETPASFYTLSRWGSIFADVDIKRFAIWPFALTSAQAAADVANLKSIARIS